MPEEAFMFGLPYEDYEQYKVRKYGFHGTSHRFVSKALAEAMGKNIKDLKIVSCHLGNGSSITAVKDGISVDTSMGFTPLDGLLMGTRTGSVDPSAVTFVMEKHCFTPAEMSDYMNKKSGLLGVSGISSDNRDVGDAAKDGNKRAKLARKLLCYQIKKYIGSYAAAMGGVDAVLFTGGIGENACDVREAACEGLEFLGITLDKEKNAKIRGELVKISNGAVDVWVVPTNEELLIARDTLALVNKK
jgi:acetate kinase